MVSNWAQYKDAHENMKRPPSKVGYFSKIEEFFSTALTAQSAQQKGTRFIRVFIVLGIYNFGIILYFLYSGRTVFFGFRISNGLCWIGLVQG